MPVSGEPGVRGNLIIEFDIQFPQVMTPEKKHLIRRALLWDNNTKMFAFNMVKDYYLL